MAAIAFVVCFFAPQWLFKGSESFDKTLVTTANEISKNCPLMVDEGTRLDSAEAMEKNTLQNKYTLVWMSKKEIDIEAMRAYMEPILVSNYKTNPEMTLFSKNNTKLTYAYEGQEWYSCF
ncbi:hypothetical protein [Maribacter arcticus]|uniref:hypothetical protein n=1 Tax=Maribacter arcticus TaxID=561365 RepID=UPI00135668D9|nr:hypothetical protein [Maribacter arcticus]